MNLTNFENRISSFVFVGTIVVAACSFLATAQSAPLTMASLQNENWSQRVEARISQLTVELPGIVVSAAADLGGRAGNMLGSAAKHGRHVLAE
jgi:hypothetical protein